MRKRLLIAVAVAAPLPATAQVSPVRDNIDALIEAHAKANGVPASFIHRVVKRESGYNPRAVGRGGAMGLMQIKHGTARSLGYSGPASGLLDAKINLTYGVAYLAGAYKTAHGNEAQAYSYYARGYYYAAKRAGIRTDVAELEAPPVRELPVNPLNKFLGSVFGARQTAATATASADPSVAALSSAVAQPTPQYTLPPPAAPQAPAAIQAPAANQAPAAPQALAAYQPAAAQVQPQAAEADPVVTVPLPPVRPASLAFHAAPAPSAGPVLAYAGSSAALPFPTSGQTVSLAATPAASPAPAAQPNTATTTVAALDPAAAPAEPEAGPKMPLPPRRPVEFRHFVVRKPAPPVPQTAAAVAPEPAAAVSQ
ncbi:lytic transglycosylase domain-containing protein [Methylobacterium sp. Gmos1]